MTTTEHEVTKKRRPRWRRWVLIVLLLCCGLLLTLGSPKVQLSIFRSILAEFSETIGADIEIKGIHYSMLGDLSVDGLLIRDQRKDTLLFVDELVASYRWKSIDFNTNSYAIKSLNVNGVRLKTYQFDEGDWNYQFILDSLSKPSETSSSFEFKTEKIDLGELWLTYDDTSNVAGSGFDYNHINMMMASVRVHDLLVDSSNISLDVRHAIGTGKSGFMLKQLAMQYASGPERHVIHLNSADINQSQIKGTVQLDKDDQAGVRFKLDDAILVGEDLEFFTHQYWTKNFNGTARMAGRYQGDSILFNGVQINTTGLVVKSQAQLIRLDSSFVDQLKLEVARLEVDDKWLRILSTAFGGEEVASAIKDIHQLSYQGLVQKKRKEIKSKGNLATNVGFAAHDLTIQLEDLLAFEGSLEGRALDLAVISGSKDFGYANLKVNFKGEGNDFKTLDAKVEGNIRSIAYGGYTYKQVKLDGRFKKETFKGQVAIADSLLDFTFNGYVNWANKQLEVISNANLKYVNIYPFRKLLKDSVGYCYGKVTVDMRGSKFEDLQGLIRLDDFYAKVGERQLPVKKMVFRARRDGKDRRVELDCDYLTAEVAGQFVTDDILSVVQRIGHELAPGYLSDVSGKYKADHQLKFSVKSKNFEPVGKFLFPATVHMNQFSIKGNMDGQHQGTFNLHLPQFELGNITASVVSGNGVWRNDTLNFILDVDDLTQDTTLWMEGHAKFQISKGLAQMDLDWDNHDTAVGYRGDVQALFDLTRSEMTSLTLPRISLVMADTLWSSSDTALVQFDSTGIRVSGFDLRTKYQSITAEGAYIDSSDQQLAVRLHQVNLGNLGYLMSDSVKFNGVVNGEIALGSYKGQTLIETDMSLTQFQLNDIEIGKVILRAEWNSDLEAISMDNKIFAKDDKVLFDMSGYVYTGDQVQDLNFNVGIFELPISWVNELGLAGISEFGGALSGNLKWKGKLKTPVVSGELVAKNASFKVDEINTTYRLPKAVVEVTEDIFRLPKTDLVDQKGRVSTVKGDVRHNGFEDLRYRIEIEAKELMALNKKWEQGAGYYGDAFVSGPIKITGTATEINITGTTKTEKGTQLFLPLSDPSEVATHDFIRFIQPASKVKKQAPKEEEKESPFDVNLILNVACNNNAEIQMVFDQTVGDVIRTTGEGDIRMEILSSGDFKMYGTYVITDGDYLFNLENLINKRFAIDAGSQVTWDGDPYQAIIDMTAIYKLRTTLVDIMPITSPDDTLKYSKRVAVSCNLMLKNKLMQPDITFDIDLPSVDEETRDVFHSMVNSSDEINKQIFALLLMNRFLPAEGRRTDNSAGLVGGRSSSELLSNQVSNWLSQLSDDFDLGINYRPDKLNQDELEIAFSTQVFNDRMTIEVNGSNNTSNVSSDEATTIVGDFLIEYKISEDGRLRAKVYNESNDYNLADVNTGLYTQGAGLFYRVDFERIFGKKRFRKE